MLWYLEFQLIFAPLFVTDLGIVRVLTMDHTTLTFKISGPLLSKLMHECYSYQSNCGGLLYGAVASTTRNEITDSQHTTATDSSICVQDYQPFSQKHVFNSPESRRTDAWSSNVPRTTCIGFYRIRQSANSLSLLEKSMHKALCRELALKNGDGARDGIVTLLITHKANLEATCLSWKVKAYVWKMSGSFSPIKVSISNLQGSVSSSYISSPNLTSKVLSGQTEAILHSFQSSISEDDGEIKMIGATREVTNNLISQLDHTVNELVNSQKLLASALRQRSVLENELQMLTAKRKLLTRRNVKDPETVQGAGINKTKVQSSETLSHDMTSKEYQREMEMQKSIEDMKQRLPIVLLEKIDIPKKAMSEKLHDPGKESEKFIDEKGLSAQTDDVMSLTDLNTNNDFNREDEN